MTCNGPNSEITPDAELGAYGRIGGSDQVSLRELAAPCECVGGAPMILWRSWARVALKCLGLHE